MKIARAEIKTDQVMCVYWRGWYQPKNTQNSQPKAIWTFPLLFRLTTWESLDKEKHNPALYAFVCAIESWATDSPPGARMDETSHSLLHNHNHSPFSSSSIHPVSFFHLEACWFPWVVLNGTAVSVFVSKLLCRFLGQVLTEFSIRVINIHLTVTHNVLVTY